MSQINFISIKNDKFPRKSNSFLLILITIFIVLGIGGIVLNWKIGVCSIITILLIFLVQSRIVLQFYLLAILVIILSSASNYFFDVDFVETLLTTVFLSSVLFLKPLLKKQKDIDSFEIFYLDEKSLKCLAIKHHEYKGYVFDPKSYLKKYPTKNINSLIIKGQDLLLSVGEEIVRPKELTAENIKEITLFVENNLPHLLNNENGFNRNVEAENKLYLFRILIFSPVLILSFFIFFFTDNGKNQPLTLLLISLMIILPVIIYKVIKR